MTTIAEYLAHAKDGMHKSVENTRREFAGIRSGKATTSLLDLVKVEAYGSTVPLNQVGLVAAPEARLLTVQAFDQSLVTAIEKAIMSSGLGLNPSTAGNLLRIPLPPLTEERRKELVRLLHKLGEEGRVGIRHHRTENLSRIRKLEKVPEDDKTRAEKEIQKLTDDHIRQIEELVAAKEAEIMEV